MLLGCGTAGGCGMDHSTLALLLIALGVGAMVKFKALKSDKCKTGGLVVGYLIMVLAALAIVCNFWCGYKARSGCSTAAKKECCRKAVEEMPVETPKK